MMFKSNSFVVDSKLNEESFVFLFTSQSGKAHNSCVSHLGIVKHYKEHGSISCCVRGAKSCAVTVEVHGYLGPKSSGASEPDLLQQLTDASLTKRKTTAGYRVTANVERRGVKEADHSGQNLRTNEPFELEIFSISNNQSSVVYCIMITVHDEENGPVKLVSLPMCVHAKKSDDSGDEPRVYQCSTLLQQYLNTGVVSSTSFSVMANRQLTGGKQSEHAIDWSAKSVTTSPVGGGSKVVYTLSKERQKGQMKARQRNSSGAAAGRDDEQVGYDLYPEIKTEPAEDDGAMSVDSASAIVREELGLCLHRISKRLAALDPRTRERLSSVMHDTQMTHQGDAFSLLLQLVVTDGTDGESGSDSGRPSTLQCSYPFSWLAPVNPPFHELHRSDTDSVSNIDAEFFDDLMSLLPGEESSVSVRPVLVNHASLAVAEKAPGLSAKNKRARAEEPSLDEDFLIDLGDLADVLQSVQEEPFTDAAAATAAAGEQKEEAASNKLQKSKSNVDVSNYFVRCHV